ncbi:MAG: NAD(P)-dependent alcohol dehydrogenase [Arenibacter algicola]|jgi:NADPH:quinone reductase-like Zn-dependent oxidoreductase|tara:strand:+ start:3693 stop:4589 length:897 start_codon:yes stop_codon:yes gene_type:complete
MKAIVYEKYGTADVLNLTEIDKPIPKNDEILIKIISTSVSAADWRLRKANPFLVRIFNGLFKPKRVKILGFEISGIVEKTGKNVSGFKKGDAVFAYCGLKFGGYAEYLCLKETDIIEQKPENMSFEEAATTPLGSLTALYFLRKANVSNGQKILIYGASGSVGTFAIQLAKYFGAKVTSVCSQKNIDLVKSLGTDYSIDYTTTDITSLKEKFDVIFDAVGKISKSDFRKILSHNGRFVSVKSQSRPTQNDLHFIKMLIESENLISIIDKTYKLKDIREAHRYVEQFRKRGNVAVLVKD